MIDDAHGKFRKLSSELEMTSVGSRLTSEASGKAELSCQSVTSSRASSDVHTDSEGLQSHDNTFVSYFDAWGDRDETDS